MTAAQIRKSRTRLEDAGTPADRSLVRTELMLRSRGDRRVLAERQRTIVSVYRRFVSAWLTEPVGAETVPTRLSDDVHTRRQYLFTGSIALLAEMGLAAWIFALRGIPPLYGMFAAVAVTFILDGALHLVFFSKTARPKEALRQLRHIVIIPAFIGFLFAAMLIALARYVEGPMAYRFLALFSLALWVGTVSLLLLAGALFCAANVYGTTLRLEREHSQVAAEEQGTTAFLMELEREDAQSGAESARREPPRLSPGSGRDPVSTAALILVLLGVPLMGTACRGASVPESPGKTVALSPDMSSARARCEIVLDLSGSVVGLGETWLRVRSSLPELVTREHCGTLVVSGFDVDGWALRLLLKVPLPAFDTMSTPLSEWTSFRNFVDAARAAEASRWQQALRSALQPLAELAISDSLPPARASDIAGVLRRFAEVETPEPLRVVIITDLVDTRYPCLPKLPPPPSTTRLVVVLAPTKPGDAERRWGRRLTGAEQYVRQARELRQSAPWAVAIPFFTEDLTESLADAERAPGLVVAPGRKTRVH